MQHMPEFSNRELAWNLESEKAQIGWNATALVQHMAQYNVQISAAMKVM